MPLAPGRNGKMRACRNFFQHPGRRPETPLEAVRNVRANSALMGAFAGKPPVQGGRRGAQANRTPSATMGVSLTVISALPAKPSATPARLSAPESSTRVQTASPPGSAWRSSAVR